MAQTDDIRIALAQLNAVVGDLQGNQKQVLDFMEQAKNQECDLIAFPELYICGYPPEDLVYRKRFLADQKEILSEIAQQTDDMITVLGFIDYDDENVYNAAAVMQKGSIIATYHKINLPNYSVFDEERYFTAGARPLVLDIEGFRIGISICEDIWVAGSAPEAEAFAGGAHLLLNISASPYYKHKGQERLDLMRSRAEYTGTVVAYNNLVGGQDELVFDGQSIIVHPDGSVMASGKPFEQDLILCDIPKSELKPFRHQERVLRAAKSFINPYSGIQTAHLTVPSKERDPIESIQRPVQELEAEIYQALVLGLRDYVHKNGFEKITLGLSGGVDSALVTILAHDALGAENVIAVSMPSQYSSTGSITDSEQLTRNLDIRFIKLPIKEIFMSYLEQLQSYFQGLASDITEENLQARIRGNLLMAFSNKFGWLVLATGNKSEVSVGYSTIYGDMVGGFSPLKDVYKMMVYRLCRYRNRIAGYDIVPEAILTKAPSAELRPDQKDEDSLPPYEMLDKILESYVEQEQSVDEIVEQGFDREIVQKVARLVDVNEYKRRQAAPGIKITPRAFGKDRRMPITNHYRAK
jgi:NAD+ synthase (glutamine-hydrolysing)